MEAHCSVVTLMELSGSGVLVVTRDMSVRELWLSLFSPLFLGSIVLKLSYFINPSQTFIFWQFLFNSFHKNVTRLHSSFPLPVKQQAVVG